jgi:8-oxo-dGTP pyrophosphatase MutT (NUDIX family)
MKEVSAAIIIEDGKIFECLEREIKEELNVSCNALNVHDEYIRTEISNLPNYKLAPADTHIVKSLLEEHDNGL